MWGFGVWLGLMSRTQEKYVGKPEGVVRSWTTKRIAKQGRWKAEEVLTMHGTTQRPDPLGDGEDVHARIVAERAERDVMPPSHHQTSHRKSGVSTYEATSHNMGTR